MCGNVVLFRHHHGRQPLSLELHCSNLCPFFSCVAVSPPFSALSVPISISPLPSPLQRRRRIEEETAAAFSITVAALPPSRLFHASPTHFSMGLSFLSSRRFVC